jgi:hypothetical protein
MKELPIIFSTPMVQALLNTKPNTWPAKPIDPDKPFKSMTRRVIIPQPDKDEPINYCTIEGFQTAPPGEEIWAQTKEGESIQLKPKYEKGDILWVRETFMPWDKDCKYAYRASNEVSPKAMNDIANLFEEKWRPSIHMPRKAARIFLKVKSVRVERLQDISDTDVKAEGWPKSFGYRDQPIEFVGAYCEVRASTAKRDKEVCPIDFCHDQSCYAAFWNTLNAKRCYSWESNPWVFVYEFMRVEKKETING